MDNRQAGVLRELVKTEQDTRTKWHDKQDRYANTLQEFSEEAPPVEPVPHSAPEQRYEARDVQARSPVGAGQHGRTIYDDAYRISTPRMVDDAADVPQFVQRKVVRQVEVPFTKQVRVPVRTKKIVPTREKRRVRTTNLVEVPTFKMVDETYTEIVEEPATRDKEVWVKKIVPEKYMRKVPVTRTRRVKVPTTVIQEVEGYEIVEVAGSKVLEVDGYRVDEVQDRKVVEVEEYQTYRLQPTATGPAKIDATRDVGPVQGRPHDSRRVGKEVYHVHDQRVAHVEDDPYPQDRPRSSYSVGGRAPRSGRKKDVPQRPQSATQQRADARARSRNNRKPRPLGVKLSDERDKNCIAINGVSEGSPAQLAGIRKGDFILRVNNKPTRNLSEFRNVVGNAVGNLSFQLSRNAGAYKLTVVVAR